VQQDAVIHAMSKKVYRLGKTSKIVNQSGGKNGQ
jgi:hypothetical protein